MTRTLLRGGHVDTRSDPHASALAVEDGQVVWAGDDAGAAHYADNADRIIELGRRLVTPAFVDAHVHLAQTGVADRSLDLGTAGSVAEALDLLAGYARRTSFPLVLGYGWDQTDWPEQRPPTREEVDRAVDGRAACLTRVDCHSAVVSTAFLDAHPLILDEDGYSPDGTVSRQAHDAAREAVTAMLPGSARQDAIAAALRSAAASGIAMVHEMGAPNISRHDDLTTVRGLRAREPLPEVVSYWGELGGVEIASELGYVGAAGDLFADGAIGSRTAAMFERYADAETSGYLYLTAEQVAEHVVACTRAGLQAGFHCIGDRAVAEVADGFLSAAGTLGRPAIVAARHRLEHVEMATPADMAVFGDLGVVASMQPMFDGLWGGPEALYTQRLGASRAARLNACGSMNRHGVALAFGSDSPVTPFDPWAGVRAAAWHHQESERLTVRAAFDAHTRGGWWAARRDEGGMIAVGAPASIAVWDVPGDLVRQLPDLHPDVDLPICVATFVEGQIAFEQPGVWT